MTVANWSVTDSAETCVNAGNPGVTTRFSDFSLYLMGFIPPAAVAPVTQYQFDSIPGDYYYNLYGPQCGAAHTFTKRRRVSVDDVIALHGVRDPAAGTAPTHFRAMFVVLYVAGETPPTGFVEYAREYASALPSSWSSATRGLSTIKVVSLLP
jgi:hypothetical protein